MVVAAETVVEEVGDDVVTTTVVEVDRAVVSALALVVGAVVPLDEHAAPSTTPHATTHHRA
jgi:hypothetical protein